MPKKKPAAQAREYIQYRKYGKERAPTAAHIDALSELLDRIEVEERNTERWNKVGEELEVDQPHLWSHTEWEEWIEECARRVETCGDPINASSSAALLRSQAPRPPLSGRSGLNEVPNFSLKALKKAARDVLRKAKQQPTADAATTDAGKKQAPRGDNGRAAAKRINKADEGKHEAATEGDKQTTLIHPATDEPPEKYRKDGHPIGPVTATKTAMGFALYQKQVGHSATQYRNNCDTKLESGTIWARESVASPGKIEFFFPSHTLKNNVEKWLREYKPRNSTQPNATRRK